GKAPKFCESLKPRLERHPPNPCSRQGQHFCEEGIAPVRWASRSRQTLNRSLRAGQASRWSVRRRLSLLPRPGVHDLPPGRGLGFGRGETCFREGRCLFPGRGQLSEGIFRDTNRLVSRQHAEQPVGVKWELAGEALPTVSCNHEPMSE